MKKIRAPRRLSKPQLVTRIPLCRPGCWVQIRSDRKTNAPEDLRGRQRQVKSLTCVVPPDPAEPAIWYVHFHDGRSVREREIAAVVMVADRRLAA